MGGGGQGTWSTMSEGLGAREAAVVCEEACHDETGSCGKDGQKTQINSHNPIYKRVLGWPSKGHAHTLPTPGSDLSHLNTCHGPDGTDVETLKVFQAYVLTGTAFNNVP